ncbi:MAG: phosphatase PAP2 family protein [Bacteroidales bacterium]|nr:phosphatase PAP2 family protein [Bacteroidales bacterium]
MQADTLDIEVETAEAVVADAVETTSIDLVAADTTAVADAAITAVDDPATRFRARQLAFPAVAIALGGAGVKNHLFDTNSDRERWTTIDDQLQYVPIVAYAGLGFIPGVKHRHNFGERFLAGATAYVFMTGMAQGLKHIVREPRPDTGKENSFPSDHTATAFCGAELCRLEYGNAYGAAAYAFAATTGVMRVVNNRHWCNDVLAGAGIGFLSAHIGYWLLPWEKRLCQRVFHRKKHKSLNNSYNTNASGADGGSSSTPFILAPSYDYETRTPSLSFSMRF